jgi:hypothetical protein
MAKYYGDEKMGTLAPDTSSIIKRSLVSNSGKTSDSAGKEYKKDFGKEGSNAPADWGECLNGKDGARDY